MTINQAAWKSGTLESYLVFSRLPYKKLGCRVSGVGCRERKTSFRGVRAAHQKKKIHVETLFLRHEASTV
jgi:hypothetical protein